MVDDRILEGATARRVVREHVEAGGGRAQQHGRRPSAGIGFERLPGQLVGAYDRLIERPRPLGPLHACVAEPPFQIRPALTDQHRGDRPLHGDRSQGAQVDPFVPTARDQDDGCWECLERRDDGIRLGALRIVDEADAIDGGHVFEAMLDAGERSGARADRVDRNAEQHPDRDGGQRVRDVVGTGDAELVDRHDPSIDGCAARQRCHAVSDDPVVDHAEPADRWIAASVEDRPGGPQVRVARDERILDVEHQRPGRVDPLGEDPLDLPVRLERSMTVEVVGRDVRVDRDRRPA
jgi:hypothetical protein